MLLQPTVERFTLRAWTKRPAAFYEDPAAIDNVVVDSGTEAQLCRLRRQGELLQQILETST
jgi:hypothetical protein